MKRRIRKELLNELLADYKGPEDLTGPEGLLKQLTGALVERALGAELTEHLGYEPGAAGSVAAGNARNGTTPKTLSTDQGDVSIEPPRESQRHAGMTDRSPSFARAISTFISSRVRPRFMLSGLATATPPLPAPVSVVAGRVEGGLEQQARVSLERDQLSVESLQGAPFELGAMALLVPHLTSLEILAPGIQCGGATSQVLPDRTAADASGASVVPAPALSPFPGHYRVTRCVCT